jgi:hypothetical protein
VAPVKNVTPAPTGATTGNINGPARSPAGHTLDLIDVQKKPPPAAPADFSVVQLWKLTSRHDPRVRRDL